MYIGVKETLCSQCDHLQVCSLKKDFIAAQQAVDNVCVSLGDRTMKDLRNFDWIKPVALECVHFDKRQPTARDISDQNQAHAIISEPIRKFMEDPHKTSGVR